MEPRGFLKYARKTAPYRPIAERVKDYREFVGRLSDEELRQQAARCMDCGTPFCHSSFGCPVFNLIPEWNDLVGRNEWEDAWRRLERTNNLPEITGRICPAPCESACTLAINGEPVTIRQIELAIIERAFSRGWIAACPPVKETGKTAAVVGSGPAGLTAAQQLRRAGHTVTVFEQADRIGGILRYGIPSFKLEKSVIDRRVRQLLAEGVDFQLNVVIGEDLSARYLRRTFDAILLAVGATEPRDMQIQGRELDGIYLAMDYLTQCNREVAQEQSVAPNMNAKDKTVLVIGGGDTGSDCVGTAIRQGARKVHQFEILPQPPSRAKSANPQWPYWPNILRTTDSHEEGCERRWSILTEGFSGEAGRVKQAHCAQVSWSEDPQGAPQMHEIPGTKFSLETQLVILAMGFLHVKHSPLLLDLDVQFDARGNIAVKEGHSTSAKGVFAAGDAHAGASLIVRAIGHARECARSVDAYLRGASL